MNHESPDNPFRLGSRYQNRKGYFTVMSFAGDTMRIRWDNGEEVTDTIESQARIHRNMQRNATPLTQGFRSFIKHIPPTPSFDVTSEVRYIPSVNSASTPNQQCCQCNHDLAQHPLVTIGGQWFCYRCAKSVYSKLKDEARLSRDHEEQRTAPARKEYKDALQAFKIAEQQYAEKRKSVANVGFYTEQNLWIIAWVIAIVCGIMLPFIGLLAIIPVLFIIKPIWEREQEGRLAAFDRIHIRPVFDRIEPTWKHFPDPVISLEVVGLHPDCSASALKDSGYNRQLILRRDDFTCQSCGNLFQPTQLEVHHILPKAQGGTDSIRNLITLCKPCHFHEDWFDHVHKENKERIREKRR